MAARAGQFGRGRPTAGLNEKAANPASAFKSKTAFARRIQGLPTPFGAFKYFSRYLPPSRRVFLRCRSTDLLQVRHLPVRQLRLCHLQLRKLRVRKLRLHQR